MAKQKCQSSFPQRYWSYTHWTPFAGVISLECHGQDHGARWWWHGAKPWFGLAKLQSFFLCRKNLDVFGRWSSFFWRLTHPYPSSMTSHWVAISIQVQDMDELDWKEIEGQEVPAQAVKRAAFYSFFFHTTAGCRSIWPNRSRSFQMSLPWFVIYPLVN